MTDLGKTGASGQGSQSRLGEQLSLPPAGQGFSGSRTLLGPWEASAFSLAVSLSDEQEDESMETTGKVEPV